VASFFGHDIDLVCIDLDDTLLDTEAGAAARFTAAFAAVRRIRPDIPTTVIDAAIARGLSTHPTEGRIANFFVDLGITNSDEIAAIRHAYFDRMADTLELMDGALDTLDLLRKAFTVFLVTNGASNLQRSKIDRFSLSDRVDAILVSGEIGSEKPDRAIFAHALRQAAVPAVRAAHVGDSLLTDVAGANDAGLLSVWIRSPLMVSRTSDPRLTPAVTLDHVRELARHAVP